MDIIDKVKENTHIKKYYILLKNIVADLLSMLIYLFITTYFTLITKPILRVQ